MDHPTIAAYDALARAYDEETVSFWADFPAAFVDDFIGLSGPEVLDIGCGPGRDAELLRARGVAPLCLDASETMVDICRSKGFEAVKADFAALPFPDHSFTGIWSYTALLHLPKQDILIPLKEIHRVLRLGGIFALGMIKGSHDGYRVSSGMSLPRWFSFYEPSELKRFLYEAGFEVQKLSTYKPGEKLIYLNYLLVKR